MNWLIKQKVDLQGQYKQHFAIDDTLMIPDNSNGHVWQIEVVNGEEEADLTGYSCQGQFMRDDGSVVTVTGSVDGNIASVTLTSECYAVPGRLRGVVTLTKGNSIVSICETYFIVRNLLEGTVIIPSDEIAYVSAKEIRYHGVGYFEVSDTTAAAEDVRQGTYFYNASGVKTAGNGDMNIVAGSGASAVLVSGDDYTIVYS